MSLELAVGSDRVEVEPSLGGRLTRWRAAGHDLLGGPDRHPIRHGCYVMAPWPGRLRDNVVVMDGRTHPLVPRYEGWAIHGLVWDRSFDVTHHNGTRAVLTSDFGDGDGWPARGRVTVTWELGPGSLASTVTVAALEQPFPAEVGWHPWFPRRLGGVDVEVTLEAAYLLERGRDHLPTGRRLDPGTTSGPYDDAFHVPGGRARVRWPGVLDLAVETDGEWFVRFDELPGWVCVEPQTSPPDGLGPDAAQAIPGAPRSAAVNWRWRPSEHAAGPGAA